jgi:GNAT superfamily N-acetyltransferase
MPMRADCSRDDRDVIRPMRPDDMGAVTLVRTSVKENHLSVEGMAKRGITPEKIIADMACGKLGAWVAEESGEIVAFSMADKSEGQHFALFTKPGHERRGYGTALLAEAEAWLKSCGWREACLSTEKESTAHRFYVLRGWRATDDEPFAIEDLAMRKAL